MKVIETMATQRVTLCKDVTTSGWRLIRCEDNVSQMMIFHIFLRYIKGKTVGKTT